MSVFDDQVKNYAVEPAAKAGGMAAAVSLLAIALHIPRPPTVRPDVLFVGTFFAVSLSYLIWRIVRRARDPATYRASGKALTLDEDTADIRRITAVGLIGGGLVVLCLWLAARQHA